MSKIATTKASHTPGPWATSRDGVPDWHTQITVYAESDGKRVATVFETEANARLIAAAPEMREALAALCDDLLTPASEWNERKAVARALLARIAGAIILILLAASAASAQSSQTATASAYARQACRSALLNVSRVADGSGTHTWASYTIWTCAPGATEPEQVQAQQNGVLIPDGQFVIGQGGQSWRLTMTTAAGNVTLTWVPDGRVHTTYDATWTSAIAGQTPTKTIRSLDTQSAPPIGSLFGLPPEAVSGTVARGSDVTR